MGAANQSALIAQASSELDVRLIEEFGSTDYLNALQVMQANPADYADGRWGLSHAGLTILTLQALASGGATPAQIRAEADRQIARWYSREAIARCADGLEHWGNPFVWSEDSRLDYVTPLLFAEWFIAQL